MSKTTTAMSLTIVSLILTISVSSSFGSENLEIPPSAIFHLKEDRNNFIFFVKKLAHTKPPQNLSSFWKQKEKGNKYVLGTTALLSLATIANSFFCPKKIIIPLIILGSYCGIKSIITLNGLEKKLDKEQTIYSKDINDTINNVIFYLKQTNKIDPQKEKTIQDHESELFDLFVLEKAKDMVINNVLLPKKDSIFEIIFQLNNEEFNKSFFDKIKHYKNEIKSHKNVDQKKSFLNATNYFDSVKKELKIKKDSFIKNLK